MKLPHIPYTPTTSLAHLLDIYPSLSLPDALALLLRADVRFMARMTEESREARRAFKRAMQEAQS